LSASVSFKYGLISNFECQHYGILVLLSFLIDRIAGAEFKKKLASKTDRENIGPVFFNLFQVAEPLKNLKSFGGTPGFRGTQVEKHCIGPRRSDPIFD